MGWSTHVKSWETALEIIHKVDRPNIGLCLDTFHIASLISHSPETNNGVRAGGHKALKESLEVSKRLCDRIRHPGPAHSS